MLSVSFAIAEHWFKPPMKVIDSTKAVINISWRNYFINKKKSYNNKYKKVYSK